MSFIAKNPLTIPEVPSPPSLPDDKTRGLYASSDGWYDVDSDGKSRKLLTEEDISGKEDTANKKTEIEDSHASSRFNTYYPSVSAVVNYVKEKLGNANVDLSDYYNKDETEQLVDNKISSVYKYCGSVDSLSDLPKLTVGGNIGNTYNVINGTNSSEAEQLITNANLKLTVSSTGSTIRLFIVTDEGDADITNEISSGITIMPYFITLTTLADEGWSFDFTDDTPPLEPNKDFAFSEYKMLIKIEDGDNLAWTGFVWDNLGGIVDLSNYATKTDLSNYITNEELDETLDNKQDAALLDYINDNMDDSIYDDAYPSVSAVVNYVNDKMGDGNANTMPQFALLNHPNKYPEWNTTEKTLTIPVSSRLLTSSKKYTSGMTSGNVVLDLSFERGIVCYDTVTGIFSVYSHNFTDGSIPEKSLLIASYSGYGAIVNMASAYKIDGNLYGVNIADTTDSVVDYSGNLLPFDDIANGTGVANPSTIFPINIHGVDITHENGVFTLNGTCTSHYSVEITMNKVDCVYATLEAGQTYHLSINPTYIGEFNTHIPLLRIKATDGSVVSDVNWYNNSLGANYDTTSKDYNNTTFDVDKQLMRFAIGITAGETYDCKVAPYVGLNYIEDYAGGTQKKLIAVIEEDVAQLEKRTSSLEESVVKLDTTLTQEGKAADAKAVGEAIANIQTGDSTIDSVVDYSGNLLPFDDITIKGIAAANTEGEILADGTAYKKSGVTITHKNGVFTLNGTSTVPTSLEITTAGTEYATLEAGKTYTMYINPTGVGSATKSVNLMIKAAGDASNLHGTDLKKQQCTFDVDKKLIRFAINFVAGVTFDNYQVAPYVGLNQDYTEDYRGGVSKKVADIIREDVAQLEKRTSSLGESVVKLEANVQPLPIMFTEERDRTIQTTQEKPADLRLVAFADSHSIEPNKYKKYNDLLSSGCVDGIIGLGDYNSYGTNTRKDTLRYITQMLSHSGRTPNCFYVVGNHDIAFTSSNSGKPTYDNVLTKKEMYDCTCRHLNGVANYNSDDSYSGYYYVDYDAAKIRMIILNTSDIYESNGELKYRYSESVAIQQPQVNWFVDKALNFSDKGNANEWSVLVCCHSTFKDMFSTILSAVKNGTSVDNTWTFKRRFNEEGTAVDQNNPVTITVNKDYREQGAVDVIGVLYGHDHNDVQLTQNGIQFIGFNCDNDYLDDYYIADISDSFDGGLSAGKYYITVHDKNFGFELTEDYPGAAIIGYNDYQAKSANSAVFCIRNADGVSLKFFGANTTNYNNYVSASAEMTEITGTFVQERIPDTVESESCSVVSIDKDGRKIRIVPYGTGYYREIEY